MSEEARLLLIGYLTKHYGTLKQRIARLVGNNDLASDALHDAWLRLKTHEVEGSIQSPGSYLVRMAINLAVNVQRRQSRSVSIEEIDALADLSDPAPGPAQTAESREEMEILIQWVERMPARRRDIFILVHWEGVTQEEAARRMGCSKRTVEYELKHAHDQLTARMSRR
ncbi:RNA polymerase sigma factor [Variovorax sp.]|jgi:RNA polymerase sigma factor (sigma-70 family)|uniref:RNA polymerase sigma factor n=1 Tax=Variovorax sp. TaxID=1871043 RepID=UPI0037D9A9F0